MPVYSSETLLYSCLKSLFGIIEEHEPNASDSLLKSKISIRFNCRQPEAFITIDARKKPVQVHYGLSGDSPTIDVSLRADTLHCLLLGDLRLGKAVGSDLLALKGPVWKTLALANLFHAAQNYYPQVLAAHNLNSTCPELE